MSIAEKLTKLAENEEKVYKAGEKAEYDRFWDIWQENGNRTNYKYGFAGWKQEVFLPKYPIIIVGASEGEFQYSNFTNLKQHCIDNGIIIDTSNVTAFTNFFRECRSLTYLPDFDVSNATIINQIFYNCSSLIEVGDLDCSNSTNCNRMFYGCNNLKKIKSFRVSEKCTNFESTFAPGTIEEIEMKGTVSADISFKNSSLLTIESLKSIITALQNYFQTPVAYTHTLTLNPASKALLEAEGATAEDEYGNLYTWIELIDNKGWNLV